MPAEQTPQTPPETPAAIDPFVANLMKGFSQIVEPDTNLKIEPAKIDETPPVPSPTEGATLGEIVERRVKQEASGEKKPEAPAAPAAAAVPDPAKPADPAPKPASKKVAVRRSTADELDAKLKEQQAAAAAATATPPQAPAKPATTPDPKPAPADEALTEEQKEEVAFAAWVEKNHPEHKGKEQETRAFLKKVDDYLAQHPDIAPGSDEHNDFQKFLESNRPKYKEGERRRLERSHVASEAAEAARRETDSRIKAVQDETNRKIFELETRPKIEKALDEFKQGFGGAIPPEERLIDPELVKTLDTKGYEELVKVAPIEAPIIAGTINAAREFLNIQNGVTPIKLADQTHLWIADFLDSQSQVFQAQSKAADRVKGGKTFMPWLDYYALSQHNPEAVKKHWTFSSAQVLDMIELNAHQGVKEQVRKLEAAGFQRKKNPPTETPAAQTPAAPPVKDPVPQSSNPGSSMMPGALPAARPINPNAAFLDKLVPGSSSRI